MDNVHYYLAYIDCSGKKYDYLQFFVAEVKSKDGKFSFERISSHYDLIPYENGEPMKEFPSGVIQVELEPAATGVPLYFSCGKVRGTDRAYVDGKPVSGLKRSKDLGVSVFGVIDKKYHEVEVEEEGENS